VWSQSTASSINIVCNQQFSYALVPFNPANSNNAATIAQIQFLIANNMTLPPIQPTYSCTPMMQPYLAEIAFPFQFPNEVPDAISYTMDNFGNLTNSTLTPLQRYPTGSPMYNGTFILATYPVYRPLSQPLVVFVANVYQFDTVTSFAGQDISFSDIIMDMSSLTEYVTAGQVGTVLTNGWTVSDFIGNQLQVNMTRNIESFMTTSVNVYGEQPQSWGAREEYGAFLSRTYGGSSPFGDPIAKVDRLITLYVSNKFIPIFSVTGITQTFTSSLTATTGTGQVVSIPPSSIQVSSPAITNLLNLGDFMVYFTGTDAGAKIYAGVGDIVAPCGAYGYGRVCSSTLQFSPFDYFNSFLDPDPLLVRFISETFANVLTGACESDPTSPSCLCGDALGGGITSLPVGQNILPSQYSFIIQVLNYELLSVTPYPAMCANCTLWDWWVVTMNSVGVPTSINNLNIFVQTWFNVLCPNALANVILPGQSVDFFHTLWMTYVFNTAPFSVDTITLLTYFQKIYASGNYMLCGNCILYSNGTTLIPPPRVNGTAPVNTCDPLLGTTPGPNVQPAFVIDALKAFQNYFCRTSSAFSTFFTPYSDTDTNWNFTQVMRPGVGSMVVTFTTPLAGAVYALTSSSICPFVTNATVYSQGLGYSLLYLTNSYPLALSFTVRVRQNESALFQNVTIGDPCNYDQLLSIGENATNAFPIHVCNGFSWYQVWNSINAFNCSQTFEVNQIYQGYYINENAKAIQFNSFYQSQLLANQAALDDSLARSQSEFNQQLGAIDIELITFNNTFTANFNFLANSSAVQQQQIANIGSITVNNVQEIAQLNIGFQQAANNYTNTSAALAGVEANVIIIQNMTQDIVDELGNETATREAEAANFTKEITKLGDEVDKITDVIIPNFLNNISIALESAVFFNNAATFKGTGWGTYVESQTVGMSIGVGITGAIAIAAAVIAIVALVYVMEVRKILGIGKVTINKQTTTKFYFNFFSMTEWTNWNATRWDGSRRHHDAKSISVTASTRNATTFWNGRATTTPIFI
jgi:hypothetical protein